MTAEKFDKALAVTLKQEGGFSDHPADHGGRTMYGIIQREYDRWRKERGYEKRDVKEISDDEVHLIYRADYWNAVAADDLPAGLDLAVFDYAVNSGPARALRALQGVLGIPQTGRAGSVAGLLAVLGGRDLKQVVNGLMDERERFFRRIGTGNQAVFLKGWLSRAKTIRREALGMMDGATVHEAAPEALWQGATGEKVRELQARLRALGYPVGAVDGAYGPQMERAVLLFQHENGLLSYPDGVWQSQFWGVLKDAKRLLPERQGATVAELKAAGDGQVARLSFLQKLLAFFGLGFLGAGQSSQLESFPETLAAIRGAVEPVQDVLSWAAGNWWLLGLIGMVAAIVVVRLAMTAHVEAYRNLDYQGPAA